MADACFPLSLSILFRSEFHVSKKLGSRAANRKFSQDPELLQIIILLRRSTLEFNGRCGDVNKVVRVRSSLVMDDTWKDAVQKLRVIVLTLVLLGRPRLDPRPAQRFSQYRLSKTVVCILQKWIRWFVAWTAFHHLLNPSLSSPMGARSAGCEPIS